MKIAYKFYLIITHKCKVQQVKKKNQNGWNSQSTWFNE